MAIDPNFAVLIYAIEFDRYFLGTVAFGSAKPLPVPADAGGQVAAWSARRLVFVKGPFDAPIVRQVESAPTVVVEGGRLCAGCVAFEEFPTEIEGIPPAQWGCFCLFACCHRG